MVANALTIAGSDSGGGAGIQADLKTFSALGVFGCSAITAVTAQNTKSVKAIHSIPSEIIASQIQTVLSDIRVDAVKIGMLGEPETIKCVAKALADYQGPIVLDPVMVAKSGALLVPDRAIAAMREFLLPRATILTPNIPESAKLLNAEEQFSDDGLKAQSKELLKYGPRAVLMKGGHGHGNICTDWFVTSERSMSLKAERVATKNTHGTGCSYSAAITSGLAKGNSLEMSVRTAHGWLYQAIRRADELVVGRGAGPIHHFHGCWK